LATFTVIDISALVLVIIFNAASIAAGLPLSSSYDLAFARIEGTLTGFLEGLLASNAVFVVLQPIARISKFAAGCWLLTSAVILYVNADRIASAFEFILATEEFRTLPDGAQIVVGGYIAAMTAFYVYFAPVAFVLGALAALRAGRDDA